jgi:hypothetical protein
MELLDVRIISCPCPGGYGIAEFNSRGERRRELTCPQVDASRNFYQPGDVLFVTEMRPLELERYVPELKRFLEDFMRSWGEWLANSFGVAFKLGQRIKGDHRAAACNPLTRAW